jgi:hypothetical protein
LVIPENPWQQNLAEVPGLLCITKTTTTTTNTTCKRTTAGHPWWAIPLLLLLHCWLLAVWHPLCVFRLLYCLLGNLHSLVVLQS